MMRIHARVRILSLGCLVCSFASAVQADSQPAVLYVAADGNDAWSGRLAKPNAAHGDGPLATLATARDRVRKTKSSGATVLVRGGTYLLRQPLRFGPQDSGTQQNPITYAAHPGEKVTLKGSRTVAGWKPLRDHIYQADLSGWELGESRFWDLYYQGQKQTLARYPNLDPQHPRSGGFLYLPETLAKDGLTPLPYQPWGIIDKASHVSLQYDPRRLDPGKWSQPTEVRVHVWSWMNWNRDILPIQAVDLKKHVITLRQPARYMLMKGNRFFIDNALEELDTPGEWYYDRKAKRLDFWPPGGENPDGKVSVSVLSELVQIEGDRKNQKFVENIHLRGFTLAESRGSLVTLKLAAHCTIAGCTLTNCGSTAIALSERSHHVRILGCDIAHVGGCGITLDDMVDWNHRLEDRVSHNVISNNHVHHVGEYDAWGAIMINPSCGGNVTHNNVVSHNLVHDTPRQGITFNGFRNVVEYNHVHHTNQEQSDTGAIGMGSRDIYERGSIIRYNFIHDTGGYNMLRPGVWDYPHYCWGVYLDDYTSGVHVFGNIIARTYRGGVMVHGGQDNVIENNIIVDGLQQQVELMPIDHISGRNPACPDQSTWLMTGTKVVNNVFYYAGKASLYLRGDKWAQILAQCDRNLVWRSGKPVAVEQYTAKPLKSWATWQKLGYDKDSLIADPLFVDAQHDDYRLRPESPALKLGFKPIPVDKIGLYKSPERASWPVADDCWREEHILYPEGR
jgi:hypothetical protein